MSAASFADGPFFFGGVYNADGELERRCLRPDLFYRHADPPQLPDDFSPAHRIESAVYAGRYFEHFGHFLIETIPALHAVAPHAHTLLAHPWSWGHRDQLIAGGFRGQLLEALGIAPSRIVLADDPMLVERLLVADLPPPPQTGISSEALVQSHQRIRAFALDRGQPGARRVYLSRRKWPVGRQLLNEEEVEAYLRKRGIEIVYPETLPIMDQVRAVAGAELLIGVEGSALHLSSFMRPGGRVVFVDTRPSGRERDVVPFPKPFVALQVINAAMSLTTKAIPVDEDAPVCDPKRLDAYL